MSLETKGTKNDRTEDLLRPLAEAKVNLNLKHVTNRLGLMELTFNNSWSNLTHR